MGNAIYGLLFFDRTPQVMFRPICMKSYAFVRNFSERSIIKYPAVLFRGRKSAVFFEKAPIRIFQDNTVSTITLVSDISASDNRTAMILLPLCRIKKVG